VWRVQLTQALATPTHRLTREEIFVVLSGALRVELGGVVSQANTGDAIVVPKDTDVAFSCIGASAEVLCCLPVGGQAQLQDGQLFTPPWAE
jgi:quercetin dioxygenase-like cupin family protein